MQGLGHQLLTAAALAQDEHGHVQPRHGVDLAGQPLHGALAPTICAVGVPPRNWLSSRL